MNPRILAVAAAAALSITPAASSAPSSVWPDSIAGTWDVGENASGQTGTLTLVQGANAALRCQRITGTLTNTGKVGTPISGFYCPDTGRLFFARKDTKGTYQAWYGQSTARLGCPTYVAGSLARLRGKTSNLGEIPFVLANPSSCH